MTPEVRAILLRAHDNGGTVRLQNIGESRHFIECFERGYITPEYDRVTRPPKYLYHVLTPIGREALTRSVANA